MARRIVIRPVCQLNAEEDFILGTASRLRSRAAMPALSRQAGHRPADAGRHGGASRKALGARFARSRAHTLRGAPWAPGKPRRVRLRHSSTSPSRSDRRS
ncbi:MAG: hypothetical protein WAU53_11840 [Rhodoplanes sp.]